MASVKIRPGVHWVGVNDRVTDLFEGLWPLPHGISYNAYLVVGERTALVDSVKTPFAEELLANVAQVVDPTGLDYLVVNHMEPDHSGALPLLRRVAPAAQILATPAAEPMLRHLYGITANVQAVEDGEIIDLGGKKLSFHHIPFVHWPETMATYEESTKVLFTCDAFGGFRSLDGALLDDQVDVDEYEDEILRYFSNIVGMHSRPVLRAIDKLCKLDVEVIAPSHGLVWHRDAQRVVDLYARWARMEGRPGVAVIFGSMYGHTRRMAEAVARGVAAAGVPVRVLDGGRVHLSYLIRESWKWRGLILGAPTYDAGIFPPVEHMMRMLERKRLAGRVVGLFGSFGWKGGAVRRMAERVEELGWELVGSVDFQGAPTQEELAAGEQLGRAVAAQVGGGER
ncbi:MAG: FprA family A-type flavoprotein [Candidatus Bipolaricaulaceae bacterium]